MALPKILVLAPRSSYSAQAAWHAAVVEALLLLCEAGEAGKPMSQLQHAGGVQVPLDLPRVLS